MKLTFARTLRTLGITAAALIASACAEGQDVGVETDETLAELEATQETLGEMAEAPQGCLYPLADCLAAGDDGCFEAFKECVPKPPKLEKLKKAAAYCKAQKAQQDQPPMMDADADAAPAEKPSAAPDKPEIDCKKVKKAVKKAKHFAKHHAHVVTPCLKGLAACIEAGESAETCVPEAKACLADRAQKAFEMMCTKGGEKCEAGELPAPVCQKIEARCAEGPAMPPLPEPTDAE